MDSEVQFQNNKWFKRLVHAERAGLADARDADHPREFKEQRLAVENAELKASRLLTRVEERRREAKASTCIQKEPYLPIAGKKIFVQESSANHDNVVKEVANQKAEVAASRQSASVFVCDDVGSPGQRIELTAIFRGARIMSPEFLMAKGAKGMQVCYHAVGPCGPDEINL